MILEKIIDGKRTRLSARKKILPLSELERRSGFRRRRSILKVAAGKKFIFIAETKKASPSAGALRRRYSPGRIAAAYVSGGADAISVITEENYFLGKLDDVSSVRSAVDVPVLRKDFIFDPYQVYESGLAGADFILLIFRILSQTKFRELFLLARSLGMEILAEVHDSVELEKLMKILPSDDGVILGINNRNLADLKTSEMVTFNLLSALKGIKIPVISESGIKNVRTVRELCRAGIRGVLVGECLLKARSPARAVRNLLQGTENG